MPNLLKKINQYQKNLERIRNYEKLIIRENNLIGHYSFGGNPQPHSEPAKIASREKIRLENINRNIVLNLAFWLENNSEAEFNEVKAYRDSWLKTTQESFSKPLSLLETLKATFEQSSISKFKDNTILDYKLTQLLGEELEQFNATETEKNNLRNYLTATQRAVVRAERQRDKYLAELNDQDHDLRKQEELLAEKNSKLTQALKENNSYSTELNELGQDLNETDDLLSSKNQTIANLTQQLSTEISKLEKRKDGKIKKVQQQLAKKRRQVKSLKQNNGFLKSQLTRYQDQDNKLRQTIQDLQVQIDSHVCLPFTPPPYP